MTDSSDIQFWENRFSVPEFIFGREPNEFLARCLPLLPKSGKLLAVADGEGRNGVWLAQQGLSVVSLDFSLAAQAKARALAEAQNVNMEIVHADVHEWTYPENAFDIVVEIFTQFSTPEMRAKKWAGMRRTLKRGGLLILQGYTPKQLEYGTGGPKQVDRLYTRDMLEQAFGDFDEVRIVEEERELQEGPGHSGMSAVISLTARKPKQPA